MQQYKIRSRKLKGYALLTYEDDRLKTFKMDFKEDLNSQQWEKLCKYLPYRPNAVDLLEGLGFEVEEIKKTGDQEHYDKIKLWCSAYKSKHPKAYVISAKEKGMLRQVEVTQERITAFMECDEWWSKPKTIGNYVARVNELNDYLAREANPASRFPNEWSLEAERKCKTGPELMAFRAHLRNLGLRPVKHEITQQVIKWE